MCCGSDDAYRHTGRIRFVGIILVTAPYSTSFWRCSWDCGPLNPFRTKNYLELVWDDICSYNVITVFGPKKSYQVVENRDVRPYQPSSVSARGMSGTKRHDAVVACRTSLDCRLSECIHANP